MGSRATSVAGELTDGSDDVGIGAAAANVAGHALADLVIGQLGVSDMAAFEADERELAPPRFFGECGGGADLTGCAVSALEAVV
jgi:hypothetical protein